ncbi:Protein of unknown function [Gryllus bimaculatus]|nr:Protein of unknown function [Gryllus bimaculatus]
MPAGAGSPGQNGGIGGVAEDGRERERGAGAAVRGGRRAGVIDAEFHSSPAIPSLAVIVVCSVLLAAMVLIASVLVWK